MFAATPSTSTTIHKAVLPFYAYASIAFLAATVLLFTSTPAFTQHHFHPQTLAITHIVALGWGTMMILGASHQLVPVLIEGKLYSNVLAYATFLLAAIGIPLLAYGFYTFNMGWPAQWGGWLVNGAMVLYLGNLAMSIQNSKGENVHAVFIFTAAAWLLITTIAGLLLVHNFTSPILSADSLHYLSLHAHLGIVGWFLLLVMGVGSRLVPMFLISKYNAPKRLWIIFGLINGALALFIIFFFQNVLAPFYLLPVLLLLIAIVLFVQYSYKAYQQRIRKSVDEPMQLSMLSVLMLLLPLLLLLVLFFFLLFNNSQQQLVLAYGFVIFFGWLTAIILGMTFKALPFIAWNKVYHQKAGLQKTPNPKDLFSNTVFKAMSLAYIVGFLVFATGILTSVILLLQVGAALLLLTALLYNWNVFKIIFHQPKTP